MVMNTVRSSSVTYWEQIGLVQPRKRMEECLEMYFAVKWSSLVLPCLGLQPVVPSLGV